MPWPVHPTGFFGARGDNDSYKIERSLRFNSADSAYLNRTPASAGNRKTWTWSGWVKRGLLGSQNRSIFISNPSGISDATNTEIRFGTSLYLDSLAVNGYSTNFRITTQVFRDVSSWYHIVVAFDTTQATGADRIKIYVNGSQVTSFVTSSDPTQNTDYGINQAQEHRIGYSSGYFDGYITEINFIDGQALTPSSFGETDAITGRWKAKAYSGTYGTNGFYLKFADNSGTTSTTLGKDSSGNGNNWTPNNFSVTAGAGNDSLVDSPTNYGSDTGVGGEVRGNYCTWNPLVPGDSAANGNLDVTNDTARGNQELMKYDSYWEITSTGGTCLAGIISTAATSTVTVGSAKTFGFKLSTGGVLEYANVTDGSSFTSHATATTPPLVYASTGASITASLNAGQRPFVATAPTGFKALCTTNLPQPTIQKSSKYMDVVTYTGTGASNSISSLGFSPDLVWIKNRGTTTDHAVYDTTRGTQLQLSTNSTAAEVTSSTGLTAFGSNGFTVGTSSLVNTSGTQYVAWAWDEAPIAGMDIVSYTGNGTTQNISHNLGIAPKMIIVKSRSAASDWVVGHASVDASSPWGYYIFLSSTAARNSAGAINSWGNNSVVVPPTSSVFTIGNGGNLNSNLATYIAYLFSEVEGFSKFGSYTGNGAADGPFVWCGFRPRWVMVKNTGSAYAWIIYDTERNTSNLVTLKLAPNNSQEENGSSIGGVTFNTIDIVSNGFKMRSTNVDSNQSSVSHIFAAFAESPFKYARAR